MEEGRRQRGHHAKAHRYRDDQQVVALLLEIDHAQHADAGSGHHAEHHDACATQHVLRHRCHHVRQLRKQPQHDQQHPAGGRHIARTHARDRHQPDVLRERRMRERVEHPGHHRRQAVSAQAVGQFIARNRLADHVRQREEHASRFHQRDHDHDAHRDDGRQLELRHAEVERRHQRHQGCGARVGERHLAERRRHQRARHDTQQHRDIAQQRVTELGQQQDRHQHERRNGEAERIAKRRVRHHVAHAVHHLRNHLLAARSPVDPHAQQRKTDQHDDRARHHAREEAEQPPHQRCNGNAEHAGNDRRPEDAGQPHAGLHTDGDHRGNRGKRDAHHDRQADPEHQETERLDQRADPSRKQVAIDEIGEIAL